MSKKNPLNKQKKESRVGTVKKTSQGGKIVRGKNFGTFRGLNYQKLFKNFARDPKFIFIGLGIGTIFLGRFAYRYFRNHPEVLNYLRDQYDILDNKIRGVNAVSGNEEVTH